MDSTTELSEEQKTARILRAVVEDVLDEREKELELVKGEIFEGGFGKWWLRVKGERVLAIMIVLLGLGFVSYLLYRHDVESKAAMERIERELREGNEIQQASLWVQTLPEADRVRLNLAKPKKILEMQR